MNKFGDWLSTEMKNRGMTQSELARKANISQAAISHILSNRRNPGNGLCESIARALRLPPELVFRKAGLLPPAVPQDEYQEELLHLLQQLPPEERQEILELVRFKLERKSKEPGQPARILLTEK